LSLKANVVSQVYWAIENERPDTLERLIQSGANVNMLGKVGVPLKIYELFFTPETFRMKASTAMDILSLECDASISPLAWAAKRGRDSMVGYLLDCGADIELESQGLCQCDDDLLLFANYGTMPITPDFYSRRIELGWPGGYSWTPLHYAICNRNASTAQLLLERGARADIDDAGQSLASNQVPALHMAIRCGLDETIDYLVDKLHVHINDSTERSVTALHLAYVAGKYDLVERFLAKGADINATAGTVFGHWTIFAMACADGKFDLALKYLRKGADPHFELSFSGDELNTFTVMRLIYSHKPHDGRELEKMRQLEKEIIRGGRPEVADTT
jgi:hypothetical protein